MPQQPDFDRFDELMGDIEEPEGVSVDTCVEWFEEGVSPSQMIRFGVEQTTVANALCVLAQEECDGP